MKKSTLIFVIIMTICSSTLFSQQLKNWYIGPNAIDMSIIIPVPVPIAPAFGTVAGKISTKVANGYYDNIGNLLFYITDQKIYDFNNEELGFINNNGSEISIVPFDNNDQCNRKFNVFYSNGGFADASSLWRAVVDMNSFSVTTHFVDSINFRGFPSSEFASIAVGKVISNVRYLYFLAGPGTLNTKEGAIKKVIINNDGSVVPAGRIYPTLTEQNQNAGGELFTRELEISPDGKWLGWASFEQVNPPGFSTQYRYHFLELNNIGNYISSSYRQFNHPSILGNNVKGFRGVEFYLGSNGLDFFIGAGSSGIYSIKFPVTLPPTSANFTPIQSSNPDFGYSQIELANNLLMYASSGINMSNNIAAFDPSISFPAVLPANSFSLLNPGPPSTSFGGFTLYTFPDQIDGQDYSLITPAAVAPVVTYNTLTFPSGGGSGQSATWTYGSNPVNNATSPIHIIHELRIKQNSTVTIKGMTFKFSPEAKVIIEEGSTLILDEDGVGNPTVLTGNSVSDPCFIPYTWKGVEIWGNSALSQIPTASGNFNQGRLVMKNRSSIEYAEWGARTWRPLNSIPPTGYATTGGIVEVKSGSFFKNCSVGVEFKPYKNIVGNILRANRSILIDAEFINTNSPYPYPFVKAPIHVLAESCNSIRITNCRFLNDNSLFMFQKGSFGVRSFNSSFTIINSKFHNLNIGVLAAGSSGSNFFRIFGSDFYNNKVSIYSRNNNNSVIQKNKFFIGGNLNPNATYQLGISSINCSGFAIEENEFSSVSPTINRWGIVTDNSGAAANQIYKNTFTGLNVGNFASGNNYDQTQPSLAGLSYFCNENYSITDFDFYVSNSSSANSGIRSSQGTTSYPAQNVFSKTGPSGTFTDFNNTSSNPINYYYNQPSFSPIYYNAPLIIPNQTASANGCPSHICPPPCDIARLLSTLEVEQLIERYDSAEMGYLNLLYSYNLLLDGGNTNILLDSMQLSWSDNAIVLRDELLAHSPYLSQDVLMEAARGDVLPPAMLLMICLANPDATRRTGFLDFLQYEIPNPLPQYMINLIVSSWDNETARTIMENFLADFNLEMAVSSNQILADLQHKIASDIDSISQGDTTNSIYKIKYWLSRIQTLSAKYNLIEVYFSERDFINAELQLSQIPLDFTLSEYQSQEYTDYIFFYNFRKALDESGSDLSQLENSSIESLINFSQGERNLAKGLAQNVLCFYYDICTEENYTLNSGNRMMNSNAPTSLNIDADKIDASVYVTPNPASSYTSIIYNIYPMSSPAILVIRDITGREEIRFNLVEATDQLYWDTSNVLSGMYYYSLLSGNTNLSNGKIVVKR